MSSANPIREVRITLTVESYEEAVQFYRDGLGLAVADNRRQGYDPCTRASYHPGTL
jgi:catechol 2,3-dioxygenase-like lactoylglutathione lyase family enzyme